MRTAPSVNVLPWLIAIAALLALPWLVTSDYYVNIASQVVIAAILALSLNLLIGFGGMISLGHAAYLGVAAYLSIYLTAHAGFGHLAGDDCNRARSVDCDSVALHERVVVLTLEVHRASVG